MFFARLALSFHKIGCASEKNFQTSLNVFPRCRLFYSTDSANREQSIQTCFNFYAKNAVSVDVYLKKDINSLGKIKKNNYIALEKYKMKNYNPIINNPNLKIMKKLLSSALLLLAKDAVHGIIRLNKQ